MEICALIKQGNHINLPISKGVVNGKNVNKIMRDTGCTTVVVNTGLISEDISKKQKNKLQFPDGKTYNLPTT